ncbi:ArsC family reductase [Maricurvus nonylphenolicus]|uniref:ArsC family reductase n=1 Tax=Maricurvus nonylphenolicus TaxID=1008307 RepID=UPI0036F2896B
MAKSIRLYGIKNCDTVKKAKRWLDDQNIAYEFHDFREDGLEQQQVSKWVSELGWETLVNKRSTTWKGLSDSAKSSLNDQSVIEVILENPTLIKRPLLDTGSERHVGFKADQYQALLG